MNEHQDNLLPFNYEVVSVYDLSRLIEKQCGKEQALLFGELALFERIPENPEALIEFFTGRTDALSQACLEKLTEKENA